MSRSHYWQYVLNSEGQPVQGAIVTLKKEPALTSVYMYEQATGGSGVTYVTTDNNGFFEFWVGGYGNGLSTDDTYAYPTNSTFQIEVSGSSILPRTFTSVQLLFQPPRIFYSDMSSATPSAIGGGKYKYTKVITHKLNTMYPFVQIYDTTTKLLTAGTVSAASVDTTTISVTGGATVPNVKLIFLGTDL